MFESSEKFTEFKGLEFRPTVTRLDKWLDRAYYVVVVICFVSFIMMLTMDTASAQKKPLVQLADETFMTQTASSVKISTSNERIFKLITGKFSGLMTGYTVKIKKDRKGAYTEYAIPFKNAVAVEVVNYVKGL